MTLGADPLGTDTLGGDIATGGGWTPVQPNLDNAGEGVIIGADADGDSLGTVDDPFAALFNAPQLGTFIWALESLFSDAYVPPANSPNGETRGWWAQDYLTRGPFDSNIPPVGSQAWVFGFRTFAASDCAELETMTQEAIAWMTQSGLADSIAIASSYSAGKVQMQIAFTKDGKTITLQHPNILAAWPGMVSA